MASIPLSDILQLSVPDRIRLVQEIWSSIADEATSFPLSDDQQEEIDRRLDDLEANPDTGVPWEEVRARLLNRR